MIGNWLAPRDRYPQPEAPDPVLEPSSVLELVRRHGRAATAVRHVDESGGEARAYFVDADIVLKVQRPHRVRERTSLAKEAAFLTELATDPAILAPQVIGYGVDGTVEYLCMTRLAGVAAGTLDVQGEARQALLHALGRTLRRVHGIAQAPLQATGLFPGDRTAADVRARLAQVVGQAVDAVRTDRQAWSFGIAPEELAAHVLAHLPAEMPVVALHSNPGPEHVFVDSATHQFGGLIDFGDAYTSHPAFDVRWAAPADRAAILDGYQADGARDDGFLATWHAVLAATELRVLTAPRFGPERQRQAETNLARLLAEL
jgi:aminoglycoside phosphotransferase